MYVKCNECGKEYFISDNQMKGGRFEFFCNNCNHKIVIISKKQRSEVREALYKGLADSSLTIKNLLDGIYYSFNIKNVILSFIVQLAIIVILSPFALIVNYNLPFFLENPVFTGILFFILFIVFSFVYDVHLYLMSLNAYNRINTGASMHFSSVTDDIINDLKSVFIYSAGIFIVFAILLLPVTFMEPGWGLVYEGIFHIALVILAFALISLFYLKKLVFAFIAYKKRDVKNNFFSLIRFIIVENINIPIYMFFISAISSIIGFMVFGLFFIVILLLAVIVSMTLVPGAMAPGITENLPALTSIAPHLAGAGGVLIGISTLAVVLFITSYIINLTQTLCSTALHIMKSSPGESVNKNAVIIAILFAALALSSVISSVFIAIGSLFSQQGP